MFFTSMPLKNVSLVLRFRRKPAIAKVGAKVGAEQTAVALIGHTWTRHIPSHADDPPHHGQDGGHEAGG